MRPSFYLEPDEEDVLVEQAIKIVEQDGDIWPGKLAGSMKISYECAEHLMAILVGRGLIDETGSVRKSAPPQLHEERGGTARRTKSTKSGAGKKQDTSLEAGCGVLILLAVLIFLLACIATCSR